MSELSATTAQEGVAPPSGAGAALPNIMAGLVVGVIVVIVAISLAGLVFTGDLSEHLADGIGMMLFSGILTTALIALLSSYPGMVAYPQERVAPILAVVATTIVASLSATGADPQRIFYTVVAAIAAAALFNGIVLLGLGALELGALIRFIPYPVIGGFLAGTGWLLVKGSLGVMTGGHIHLADVPHLFSPEVLPKVIVGAVFGTVLVTVTHKFHHYSVMPTVIAGGVALFYGGFALLGRGAHALLEEGWLLGPFPAGGPWRPLSVAAFSQADWWLILGRWPDIATVLVITLVSVLLNSGAMELVARTDIDLNRELKAAGVTNVLLGLGGGTVGFHSLSISRLVHRMGPQSRWVGLIAAAVCAGVLAIGTEPIGYLPRAVLGGLLFFLGMHFLIDWVYDAWFRLTRADYWVVIMILGVIAFFGYLVGVAVGIVACVVLFLVNYSRVDVVKHSLSGKDQHSNVDRPAPQTRLLEERGGELYICKLHGFIFFGTANGLLERVRGVLDDSEGSPLRFLIFDFKGVTGVDSSSTLSFVKVGQLAEKHGFLVIFTEVSAEIRRLFDREGFDATEDGVYRFFSNLDHGLEWCENQILLEGDPEALDYTVEIESEMAAELGEEVDIQAFLGYFERLALEAGDKVVRQSEPSDALYLIDRGQVTAVLETVGEGEVRLRTMCPGTIVGEIGLLLDEPRTASVVADGSTTVYRLSDDALKRMEQEQPHMAAAFYRFLTRLLAERLAKSNRALEMVLE